MKTLFRPPPLYPIVDLDSSLCEPLDLVRRLLAAGVSMLQLRGKSLSVDQFHFVAQQILTLVEECCKYRPSEFTSSNPIKIIINDNIELCRMLGASGVHLGQSDTDPRAARQLLGETAIIGWSTHNLDQVRAASSKPVDYIGFGPIFPTTSKTIPDPVTGIELLREAVLLSNVPVVAIGGITKYNCQELFQAGASSVAVIRELALSQAINLVVADYQPAVSVAPCPDSRSKSAGSATELPNSSGGSTNCNPQDLTLSQISRA